MTAVITRLETQGGAIGVDLRLPAGSTFWFELPA